MIEKLFKDKIINQLKIRILKNIKKEISNQNSEEYEQVLNNINKDNISINDINHLLESNSCLDINKLIELVDIDKFDKKYIKYIVYSYLISNSSDKSIKNLIISKLGYKYDFNDINLLDGYIIDKSFINNDMVFNTVDKIWSFEKNEDNTMFKEKIKKLIEFKKMIDNNLFPDTLLDNFVKVKKYKNLYYQLTKIENIMKGNSISEKDKLFCQIRQLKSLFNKVK